MQKLYTRLLEKKLTIPFINTNPVTDIGVLFGLIPIWWLIGVEQIIWPFVFLGVALKIVYIRKGKILIVGLIQVFFVFLILQLVSALSITDQYTWLVFLRNFAVFITVFMLLFILINSISGWEQIKWLLKVILITMGFSAFIGFLGVIGIWRPHFYSPLRSIFPEWIFQSNAGTRMVLRSIGIPAYFLSIHYFRLNDFFSFPTLYATALITIIPLAIYWARIYRKDTSRIIWLGIIGLLLINLLFTTGRTAVISLLAGFILFQLFIIRKNRVFRWFVVLTLMAIALIFLSQKEIITSISNFLSARSTAERLDVYSFSLQWWAQHPIFGWGTARTISSIEGLQLPLGSHSYYIAILFRFGLVGFSFFALMYWLIWKNTRPLSLIDLSTPNLKDMNNLLIYGRWVIFALLVDGIATVPITDMMTMIIVWLIFSLLLMTRRFAVTLTKNFG